MDEQPQIASERNVDLVSPDNVADQARQDVLDQLWNLFTGIVNEADIESGKDSPDVGRLATLVRISSQAGDNYRYHAGH
jgi:hypothetical protein